MSDASKIGRELWAVQTMNGKPRGFVVKVTKVGRKWITLDNGWRCDRVTGIVDGGAYSPPGKVYATKQFWLDELENKRVWDIFCAGVRNIATPPPTYYIKQAAERLSIDLEKGEK